MHDQTETCTKLVFTGRAKSRNAERKLIGTRINPEVLDRLTELVSGPQYLAIEYACEMLIKVLDESSTARFVDANS